MSHLPTPYPQPPARATGPGPHRLSTRIASLDGLRALAILLVLIGHGLPTIVATTGWLRWPSRLLGNGPLGVEIFFVISGFLITRLLMHERQRNGKISLSQFYLRRTFRILPAFYCFILFIVVCWWLGRYDLRKSDLLAASTFVWNYKVSAAGWVLGHIWSLSVEEQFYLIWPLALVLLGNRAALRFATALVLAEPFIRVATYALFPSARGHIPIMLHTRIDALMFGCVTALLYENERFNRLYLALCRFHAPMLAAVFIFVLSPILETRFQGAYLLPVGYSMEGASIALILVWLIRNAGSATGRLFNSAPARYVGVLSYSLYLWQQPFFDHEKFTTISRFPLNLILLIVAAHASYHLIERPFLSLRQRFEKHHPSPQQLAKEAAATEAMPAI